MIVQGMYWDQYDRNDVIGKYEHSERAIYKYINENLDGDQRKRATFVVDKCLCMRKNNMKKGQLHNFGGYPLLYIFKNIVNGNYKRMLQPMASCTFKMFEYEGYSKEQYDEIQRRYLH